MAREKFDEVRLPDLKQLVEMYRTAITNNHTLVSQMAEAAVLKVASAEAAAAEAAVFAKIASQGG